MYKMDNITVMISLFMLVMSVLFMSQLEFLKRNPLTNGPVKCVPINGYMKLQLEI